MSKNLPSKIKHLVSRDPLARIHLDPSEIIVDNFAGGGGASSGVSWAANRSPDIAINHDPEAIAMHKANHPETEHYIEDVWQVDPVKACAGHKVGLAWFSPTCTHFSKAKGTALDASSLKIRGLAWVAVRWAAAVRPRIICLENVEEFQKWGPLHRQHTHGCRGGSVCRKSCLLHKPIKERQGELFKAFVSRLRKLGYVVEWRQLRACDYGSPTTRKRLFMVARCDGKAISWPAATHAKNPEGKLLPYRTAAEVIDWSTPCPSIFERDRPLADKTLARIARGIKKFVLENPRPFIVPTSYGDKGGADVRVNSVDEPLRTICGNRGSQQVVMPILMKAKTYGGGGNDARSAEGPLTTITASKRGEHAIVVPYLVHRSNGERPEKVDADGTVHAAQAPRIYSAQDPLGTIMSQGQKHAACVALLIKNNGGNNDRNGNLSGQELTDPVDTIACKDQKSLTVAHLVKMRGTSESHIASSASGMDEPVPCVTASGTHVAQVAAFLVRYNGAAEHGQEVDKPIGASTTKPRFGLVTVTIEGEEYIVADIGMRMLTPRELYRAQGFADETTTFQGSGWADQPHHSSKSAAQHANLHSPLHVKHEFVKRVAVHVLIDCARNVLEIRSHEKSPVSARTAQVSYSSRLSIEVAASARALVSSASCAARIAPTGKVASILNKPSSITRPGGKRPVNGSGCVTMPRADVAQSATSTNETPQNGLSITLQDGLNIHSYDSNLQTLCSFVESVMTTCTRSGTLTASSFDIQIEVRNQYIIDPVYNGKPLTKTAQIRMCGNSVPPQMAQVIARAQLEVA